jgi:protein ImuB
VFACIHSQSIPDDVSLPDFAYGFSPLVEETAKDTVVIDAAGCELLFGSAYELANEIASRAAKSKALGGLACKVNVALAANPDAAILAARYFKGVTFIAPDEELTGLGELPIEELKSNCPINFSLSSASTNSTLRQNDKLKFIGQVKRIEEIIATLRLWGVRTLREFAALPAAGIAERLGQEGVALQLLAAGKSERHLKLVQPPPSFADAIELEHPLAELEPLAFILARLLNQLCAKLIAYALATNELRVQMKLEHGTTHERTLNLPYPMRDHKVFLKLLLLDTEMHPPQSAVIAISIACEPVKPRVLQNGLFIPLAPEPEKLELTLARLAKLVGPANVGSPELIDTHRPDAFRVKRFELKLRDSKLQRRSKPSAGSAGILPAVRTLSISENPQSAIRNRQFLLGFRMFRPPLKAMVEAARGYPTEISAWGTNRSVFGKISRLAGPWRTTGDWWRDARWARDEWDVAVAGRAATLNAAGSNQGGHAGPPLQLYRIYRDLRSALWFVEGVYD